MDQVWISDLPFISGANSILSDGCSHVKGSSSVQCCLRTQASQPGGASGSAQEAPVPNIEYGQPLPQSYLPIDYEQAAQDFRGPTDFELAAIPELTQFSLPDAGFFSTDEVYDSYVGR